VDERLAPCGAWGEFTLLDRRRSKLFVTALHRACKGLQRLDGAMQDACAASTSGAAA